MSGKGRARASGEGGRKRLRPGGWKRSLWSLVSRLFGTPKGRHVAGAPPPPPPLELAPPVAAEAPAETPSSEPPVVEAAPIADSEIADLTTTKTASVAAVVKASVPAAATPAGLASVRLIFTDGSVVPLPAGSVEERQAQYLARRVLEAGGRA